MKRIPVIPFLFLFIISCGESSLTVAEQKVVNEDVHQTLINYCNDVKKSGLVAEFNYLDSSTDFYWIPPGYSDSISYDSVAAILKRNAPKYRSIDNTFEILEITPQTNERATYSGRLRSVTTDTSGKAMTFILIENGTMVKRESGWKLLNGKTAVISDETKTIIHPRDLFTLSDAEKILGESAHLSDSVSKTAKGISQFNSTYTANAADKKSGKTGNIYFMFEEYPDVASAHEAYASIKKANADHEGIETLNDYGEEAYFHTDNMNFNFILVRKNNKMFRLKVNKLTPTTSREEFKTISKQIAEVI
jgi:hypothetical protein